MMSQLKNESTFSFKSFVEKTVPGIVAGIIMVMFLQVFKVPPIIYVSVGFVFVLLVTIFIYHIRFNLFQNNLVRKSICNKLAAKYGCKFKFTNWQKSLSCLIGECISDEIKQIRNKRIENDNKEPIRIGIICGPMITDAFKHMAHNHRIRKLLSSNDIEFVAMNRAGDAVSQKDEKVPYVHSANYQVTRFSEMFKGSKAVAFTLNPYDIIKTSNSRNKIDILICSVGRLHEPQKSYLAIWLDNMNNPNNYNETPTSILEFTEDCTGDFCLMPIDYRGKIAGSSTLIASINNYIDPFPKFDWLGGIKKTLGENTKVICPIKTEVSDKKDPTETSTINAPDKERIVTSVLRSGIVDVCVMDLSLAQNLCKTVGEYLIENVRWLKGSKCYSECTGKSIKTLREFKVLAYDPNNRLQKLYRLKSEDSPRTNIDLDYPKIIISEYINEDQYQPKSKSNEITIHFNGDDFPFEYSDDARKPGQWSLATYAAIRKCLDDPKIKGNQQNLDILDLGCGSGIIGILTAKLHQNQINSVLCIDNQEEAIDRTKINIRKNGMISSKITVKKSDMFNELSTNQKYDIIAFNPPFKPESETNRSIDTCRHKGGEYAILFCETVIQYLNPKGIAILTIADYAADIEIEEKLTSLFGGKPVIEDRVILYPENDKVNPPAYEIKDRKEIEKICNYRFETNTFGGEKYISFGMRHYFATKT